MDKLQRVQDEIGEATDVMRQNLEQVVGRGEHLELLVEKSDDFSANARAFQNQSGTLRRAMWCADPRPCPQSAHCFRARAPTNAWSGGLQVEEREDDAHARLLRARPRRSRPLL
jgi:hypothetical protein